MYTVFSAKTNTIFTWKVEWPSDNFGSLSPSTVMCYSPNTGTKWMALLIVLSSYCNTICSMAGRRGVCHQFDCAHGIFIPSFLCSLTLTTTTPTFLCLGKVRCNKNKYSFCLSTDSVHSQMWKTTWGKGMWILVPKYCNAVPTYIQSYYKYSTSCFQSFLWP